MRVGEYGTQRCVHACGNYADSVAWQMETQGKIR
jgi:hypothetical protein